MNVEQAPLDEVCDQLEHQNLNTLAMFADDNPTTENVARFIFESLTTRLPSDVRVERVNVWESSRSAASYEA